MAYPIYVEKKDAFELGNNLIESYLAAKAEDDLLERRGVKLAVSLELLKRPVSTAAELCGQGAHHREVAVQQRLPSVP